VKPIELNRNNYSFNEVRDEVRVKYELRDFQLRYVSSSLGDLFIQDNDSFRRAVKDAELRGVQYVEIKVISHEKAPPQGKGYTGSSQSYSSGGGQQQQQSYSPQYNSPQPYTPSYSSPAPYAAPIYNAPTYNAPPPSYGGSAPSPSPRYVASPPPNAPRGTSPNNNVIASFVVQGDRNSSADRLSMKANQESDHFAFVPTPAKYPSDVSIILDNSKLTCESVTNHPDGRSIKFTQAFNLPFTPTPSNIQVSGQILKIFF
jgi:hypothetical protein